MKTLLIFVTLLAAVSARNVPNADYVPTKEELTLLTVIFGADAHIPAKTTAIETPAVVPNESDTVEENILLSQKINEIFNSDIKVNDCDKKGAHQNETQNPVEDDPDVHTRFEENGGLTDDRVSLDGKNCPSNKIRFNGQCVKPD